MISHPYPFLTPGSAEDKLYVAFNRFIAKGAFSYGADEDTALNLLREECAQKWSAQIAPGMANSYLDTLRMGYKDGLTLIEASGSPSTLLDDIARAYYGETELMGPDVSFTWPDGRISRVIRLLGTYTFTESNVMYVRHEFISCPGKINHVLKYK
ncbi:hypothetical protein ACSX1A_04015 [Pontibacter sp. MBLB2868]|uniref:hypothetical protein n=1 Tax=Pontibacter sp. MBLB2868 TaxID=3451555 RepID=UPI003F74F727